MEAVNAHQRSFEHLIGVSDTNATLIAALAKNGVWQCPTVINSVGTAADFTSDPGLPFWLKQSVEGWRKTAMERLAATDSAGCVEGDSIVKICRACRNATLVRIEKGGKGLYDVVAKKCEDCGSDDTYVAIAKQNVPFKEQIKR
jgi:NADH:ubiquinone oxidoreductase subunit F (NADH-binding)